MENEELQQQLQQLEGLVKQKLTKDALSRLGNIKAAHEDRYLQLLVVLGQLINSGEVETIDDTQLKELLIKMAPEKKETKIKRL
ncbi:MAG: DNA-binding protein [Candidatus Woesearchaeota archaeon]|jgi:DNA-binding TFAR19-related protein (PDSD5 family)|nr:DNA-binding protein [Candidatus Woesearchaeota archaeon]MDP7180830.1 DNA-binding protein [Candidatus Woesearchaeota archaeon]MDP7457232.1 DNA-binding protein [Candidatus Woesearchaeota archaeon]